ncbi:phosphoribosyltransferase [Candidatus Gottesmanbacteria bacterium]|nr:phosphoribosyltransferase [Candidatus Gottesmanbacteria bacterium]
MEDVVTILKKIGAVMTDSHFVYTSGKHGSVYINKDALYPHTIEASKVGKLFAEKFKNEPIDAIAAPALGGIVLSQWTAHHLSEMNGKDVLGLYTEKMEDGSQVFRRGYDKLIAGKNVLVIEDLTTTGGSVKKVVDAVRAIGGTVIAVCVMVNRDPKNVNSDTVGAPFSALGVLQASAVDAADCQLCKKGVPINTSVGHGKKFLEEKGS